MRLKQVLLGTILALAAGVAAGGAYRPAQLTIDLDNQVAFGDMYSARLSGNAAAFIGCGVRSATNGFLYAFCQANLGPTDETIVQCFTEDPGMVATVGAMDDFSYVVFSWDADGNCRTIGNSTQSFYLPEFYKTDKVK